MSDKRVEAIRDYLIATGDYTGKTDPEDKELFGEDLETAVKHFQFRHNLTQDGFVGKGTVAHMNWNRISLW